MKTYTVTRYGFAELSPEAQGKAIEKERSSLYNFMPSEFVEETLRQELETQLGAPNSLRLRFSLSYCQGDGVSFTGRLDREEAPLINWPKGATYAEFLPIDFHYCHAWTVRPELFNEEGEEVTEGLEEFRAAYVDICRRLEKVGYADIEGFSSEAAARESLEDVGEVFLIDGSVSIPQGVSA